jgi:hypothetical protein
MPAPAVAFAVSGTVLFTEPLVGAERDAVGTATGGLLPPLSPLYPPPPPQPLKAIKVAANVSDRFNRVVVVCMRMGALSLM